MTSHCPLSTTFASRLGRLFAVVGLLTVVLTIHAEPPVDKNKFAFDKDRLYVRQIVDLAPLALDGDERVPFEDVILLAHGFKAEELNDAARRDISVSEMLAEKKAIRDEVRFELVHIEGKLKRLKKIPSLARLKDVGIEDLYEAWIFPRGGRGTDPVCVIITEPPTGIKPADDITPGVPVSTAGYYFKVLEYQSNQPNPKDSSKTMFRRAPLLLGHALTVGKDAEPANASYFDLGTVSLVFGGAVLAVLVGMAVWLRRTDSGSRRANTNRLRNPYTAPPDDPTGEPTPRTNPV